MTSGPRPLSVLRGMNFHLEWENTPADPALQFRAIKNGRGWAFQHVQTQQYLGIPYNVVGTEGAYVSTVEETFTWMIIPHHHKRDNFK
jgi:hypothetical protein